MSFVFRLTSGSSLFPIICFFFINAYFFTDCRPPNATSTAYAGNVKVFDVRCIHPGKHSKKAFVVHWGQPESMIYIKLILIIPGIVIGLCTSCIYQCICKLSIRDIVCSCQIFSWGLAGPYNPIETCILFT